MTDTHDDPAGEPVPVRLPAADAVPPASTDDATPATALGTTGDGGMLGFDPPPDLPPAIRTATIDAAWLPLGLDGQGLRHHELRWPDGRGARLTASPAGAAGARATAALQDERDRLAWFAPHVPVPEVLEWAVDDDGAAFLLTAALPGSPAIGAEHGGDAASLIVSFAEGLQRFHSVPVEACPFPLDTSRRIELARARVAAGAVRQHDLDPAYRPYPPEALLDLMIAGRPTDVDDAVVVHGSYTLEHVHLDGGTVVGYTNLARAGVSDRYVDLAVAAHSLARCVSPEALGPFFDAYGIALPDVRKVDFFVLLDAFF